MAWEAAPAAWVDAALNNCAYGVATAFIAAEAAPCHASLTKPEVTDENDDAAVPSSEARPSQAAAASSIGADPAPENIKDELISGGNIAKFVMVDPYL